MGEGDGERGGMAGSGACTISGGSLTLASAMEAGGHWKEKRIRSNGGKDM